MRNANLSLSEILEDFNFNEHNENSGLTGGTVTIWLSREDKARYDKLQEKSGRRFSKKVRETLLALINMAEARSN